MEKENRSSGDHSHAMRNGRVDDIVLWAIGSNSRKSGRTTLATSLAGLMVLKGYKAQLLKPHDLVNFANSTAAKNSDKDLKRELDRIYHLISPPFRKNIERIFDHIQSSHPQLNFNQSKHVLLDLDASISHDTLDLFLTSDVKLIIQDPVPKSMQELIIFVNSCFLRLLELSLIDYDVSLHDFIQRISKEQKPNEFNQFDFFDAGKLKIFKKHLHETQTLLVLNRIKQGSQDAFGKDFEDSLKSIFPNLARIGQLPDDNSSAHLIAMVTTFFEKTIAVDRQNLFRYIKKRADRISKIDDSKIAMATDALEAKITRSWPYSIINNRLILNLDPIDFEELTPNSNYGAFDHRIFDD